MVEAILPFSIEANANGSGSVRVGDSDVSDFITGCNLHIQAGQAPVLTLQESRPGSVKGEGIVRVFEDSSTAKEVVQRFLYSIDANRLEQQALEVGDFGTPVAETILSILRSMAERL